MRLVWAHRIQKVVRAQGAGQVLHAGEVQACTAAGGRSNGACWATVYYYLLAQAAGAS